MRDYQQAAIELGFLHNRYLRGTPAARLRRARPGVRRPDRRRAPVDRLPRTGGTHPMSQAGSLPPSRPESTQMLTALVRLRGALQDAGLPLELPGVEEQRGSPREMVDQLEDYVIPRRDDARRAAARGGRRLHRRRQVDAGQLAGRRAGSPSPACCGPPPGRRCSCTTPTTPTGSARTGCCPTSSGSTAPTNDPAPCSWWRLGHDAGRASRSSTRPTSTRSRSATAPWPRSCWPPPTSGSSSPPPRATPTRCRGASCARPPTGPPRSRSCSTARPPDAVETVVHPPGPDARQPRPQGLAAVHGHRGPGRRRRAAAAPRRSPTSAAG